MTRCVSCSRPTRSPLCPRCVDRLADALDPGASFSVPSLYVRLTPFKVSGGDGDGRRAPGFRSTAPASTHTIALTDHRSKAQGQQWRGADGRLHHEPRQGLLNAPTVLVGWLEVACEMSGDAPPSPGQPVHALAGELLDRLDDIVDADWSPDMADEVRVLWGQLRTALAPITGERRPRAIGHCPVELPGGERCGSPLYVPRDGGTTIVCKLCGSYWRREDWIDHLAELVTS